MSVTKTIAAWAAETPEIESDVALLRARHAIHDVIACMVAGAGDEGSARVRATVSPYGNGPATVFGATTKAPTPWAALANGMAAHALDFDDNYLPGYTHATAVLIPALLPLAEGIDASGRQLMDAYIVGLEMHAAEIQVVPGRGVLIHRVRSEQRRSVQLVGPGLQALVQLCQVSGQRFEGRP